MFASNLESQADRAKEVELTAVSDRMLVLACAQNGSSMPYLQQ